MTKIENILGVFRYLLLGIVITISIFSILALMLWDVWAGSVSVGGISRVEVPISQRYAISLATTGALIFIGYLMVKKNKSLGWGAVLLFVVYTIDEYFDSLGADITVYGRPIVLASLPMQEKSILVAFRLLFAALSSIGEFMAIELLTGGWDVVLEIARRILPSSQFSKSGGQRPAQQTQVVPQRPYPQRPYPQRPYPQRPASQEEEYSREL